MKFNIPLIGINDVVISWDPADWHLRIWFVKHLVLENNGGAVPDLISGLVGEVANFSAPFASTKGIELMKLPIEITLLGYTTEAVSPVGFNAISFSAFDWGIPSPGGIVGMPPSTTVFWQFDPSPDPKKSKLPAATAYGGSFTFPPTELSFRINGQMPTKPTQFRLRGGNLQPELQDDKGVVYSLVDVTSDYLNAFKTGDKWHVPGRIVELNNTAGKWSGKLLAGKFFLPSPTAIAIVVRAGNLLKYFAGSSLIGADNVAVPTLAASRYNDVVVNFEIEGAFPS